MTVEAPLREAPVAPVTPEKTTKPKLSELMKLGAIAVGKQGKRAYVYYKKTEDPQVSSVCALGAVIVGAGRGDVFLNRKGEQIYFSALAHDIVHEMAGDATIPSHPVCSNTATMLGFSCGVSSHSPVAGKIIHLNDDHKMPIREIADYLQSQGL